MDSEYRDMVQDPKQRNLIRILMQGRIENERKNYLSVVSR